MSFISTILNKVQAPEKATTTRSNDRAAVIDRLCEARGAEYRGLKQYRNL
jgi:hypothetical protein